MLDAVRAAEPLPIKEVPRPGTDEVLRVRQVPPPTPRPAWLTHARLRRTSPITQYIVASALEAVGEDAGPVKSGALKLGIIVTVMSGCVNYSRRFYDEALRDPATASPLVFPETVFNAPASHIAALLGTHAINYTLVGDPGTFLQGLALAADWLLRGEVDGCVVVGAEEIDWLTSHAFRLFHRRIVLSDGAGAVYLKRTSPNTATPVRLGAISDSHLFTPLQSRAAAVQRVREQLNPNGEAWLIDGVQNLPRYDTAEIAAWQNWNGQRVSPKKVLGEGLMAAAAWQCLLGIAAIHNGAPTALISVAGTNQQAIGAAFTRA